MLRRRPFSIHWACALVLATAGTACGQAGEAPAPTPSTSSWREQVDELVDAARVGPAAPTCSDAEFLRRVYLNLHGTIPDPEVTRWFLQDESPDKRELLVDQLLEDPRYAVHMAGIFDVILMERRGGNQVTPEAWRDYLVTAFAENRPWNELAREILAADGVEADERARVKFYLDRQGETNLLTRDVGRIFFGQDLQCAQCHDHPLIDDYYQADYYGLFAFLNRSFVFTDKEKKTSYFAEKAEGDVTFSSVFTGEDGETGPRLPGGPPVSDPALSEEELYLVKPENDQRPVPRYSRRARLAELATDGSNDAFNRNIANRLWAHMMGRGLVHPVDLHSSMNPPAVPGLLEMLGDEFARSGYDIRAFLRELALTETYQRGFDAPDDILAHRDAAGQQLEALEAPLAQARESTREARLHWRNVERAKVEALEDLSQAVAASDAAAVALAQAETAESEARAALTQAETDHARHATLAQSLREAAESSRQVAESFAEDAELAAAAATLEARRQAHAEVVTASEQRVVAARTGAENAASAAASARADVAAAEQAQEAARESVAAQTAAATLAEETMHVAIQLEARLTLQRDAAELLVQAADARAAFVAARDEHATVTQNLAEARETAQQNEQLLAELSGRLPDLEAEATAASEALAVAQATLEEEQATLDSLADAAAKAAAVREMLPDDAEVAEAAATLAGRRDSQTATRDAARESRQQAAGTAASQQEALEQARDQHDAATGTLAEARSRIEGLTPRLAEIESGLEELRQQASNTHQQWLAAWEQRFATAQLQALAPEALAWSMLQASGQVARQRAASLAELEAARAEAAAAEDTTGDEEAGEEVAETAASDAGTPEIPPLELERHLATKLDGNVKLFVSLFGNAAGSPQDSFFATVDQALFFANGGQLQGWLSPGSGSLIHRAQQQEDPALVAEELYLSILVRYPTEAEVDDVKQYLAEHEQRTQAVQELAWALFTSTEFRFWH